MLLLLFENFLSLLWLVLEKLRLLEKLLLSILKDFKIFSEDDSDFRKSVLLRNFFLSFTTFAGESPSSKQSQRFLRGVFKLLPEAVCLLVIVPWSCLLVGWSHGWFGLLFCCFVVLLFCMKNAPDILACLDDELDFYR